MIRFNSRHKFNTPIGVAGYSDDIRNRLLNFRVKAPKYLMLNIDYTKIQWNEYPADTVFYFDPPYYITSAAYNDGKRGMKGWGITEEIEMLSILKQIDQLGYKFMLSNVIEHNGKRHELLEAWVNENNYKIVDALFFYVDPDAGNANDFLASKIPPVILGIYRNYASSKRDLHINNMPVYVVSVCTSSRVSNASVKQQIICAETMGIKYIDVFDNPLYDILNSGTAVDEIKSIKSIKALDELVSQSGTNDSFQVDEVSKTLSVICVNMLHRTNDTAYIYRWFLKCIPAIYLASKEGYTIDLSAIRTITSGDIPLIRGYIEKYPRTI